MQNNHHHTGADRAFTAKGALCTVLLAVCLMGTMTACSSKENKQIQQTAASRAEQRRADSLALKVAVTPTTDCLPVFVAKERGLFDDHGVAVSLKCKQSHMDCDQAMLDEKVEMMASDLMRTERLIHNGLPLTYVTSTNAYWQLIGNRLYSQQDFEAGVRFLEDNWKALHLDRMVTDRLGLTEINRAIEMMLHGENICKIIIDPEK